MPKQELEFFDAQKTGKWERPEGYPEGVTQLIITECPETKAFTRFVRFVPGAETTQTLSHECWEEVYIIKGELIAGSEVYTAGMTAVRPPHMPHGPFRTINGCLTYEVHYYSR
jgi:hypothetical protein